MRVRGIIGVAAALCALLLLALPAFAYDEPHDQPRKLPDGGTNHGAIGERLRRLSPRGRSGVRRRSASRATPDYGGTGLPTRGRQGAARRLLRGSDPL